MLAELLYTQSALLRRSQINICDKDADVTSTLGVVSCISLTRYSRNNASLHKAIKMVIKKCFKISKYSS